MGAHRIAALGLIDRVLLELDTDAHARLWEDRRHAAIDRRRAAHLAHRLRPRPTSRA